MAAELYTPIVGAWRSPVSALVWGTRGRRFKSSRSDHKNTLISNTYAQGPKAAQPSNFASVATLSPPRDPRRGACCARESAPLRGWWLLLQRLQMKHAAGHSIWLLARFLGPLAGPENTNPCVGGLVDRKLLRLVAQITADRFDADRGRLRWARGRFRWAQRLCRRRHLPHWVGCSVSLEQKATASGSGAGCAKAAVTPNARKSRTRNLFTVSFSCKRRVMLYPLRDPTFSLTPPSA